MINHRIWKTIESIFLRKRSFTRLFSPFSRKSLGNVHILHDTRTLRVFNAQSICLLLRYNFRVSKLSEKECAVERKKKNNNNKKYINHCYTSSELFSCHFESLVDNDMRSGYKLYLVSNLFDTFFDFPSSILN